MATVRDGALQPSTADRMFPGSGAIAAKPAGTSAGSGRRDFDHRHPERNEVVEGRRGHRSDPTRPRISAFRWTLHVTRPVNAAARQRPPARTSAEQRKASYSVRQRAHRNLTTSSWTD